MSEDIKRKKKKKKKKSNRSRETRKAVKLSFREKVKSRMPRFSLSMFNIKILVIIVAVLMVLGSVFLYFVEKYTVDTVIVEGSSHYSTEEINSMVIGDGFLAKNSIVLSLKYRNKEIRDIPFIETMSVRIMSPTSIKITIYEKAIAGYVDYMGQYIYFDKDGTVIESSSIKTAGIPQVIGMEFDHIVMYERLPVSDDEVFKEILDVSQLMDKYEISVDKIYFDDNYNITLYFDQARVKLGNFDNIDEKIIRLKAILPELDGKKGVLKMENYTPDANITTFEYDE